MPDDRQHLKHWDVLVPGDDGADGEILKEAYGRFSDRGVGEIELVNYGGSLFSGSGAKRAVRVTRRDIEVEVSAQAMGSEVFISWDVYYRPSWSDRMPNLFRTVLPAGEKQDVMAFASVTLNETKALATDFAMRQGRSLPSEDESSGVLGPLD
ncbi:MAG: hypothetical protein WBQ14_02150 [Gaiellaceae bacterium]